MKLSRSRSHRPSARPPDAGLWDVVDDQEAVDVAYDVLHDALHNDKGGRRGGGEVGDDGLGLGLALTRRREAAATEAAEALLQCAMDRGSGDNVTVVIMFFRTQARSRSTHSR